jgi:hypothetical protein
MADYTEAPLADGPKASTSVLMPGVSGVPYSGLAETARSFGQGLTFGTLDEIEAALRTGSISGPEYEKQRNLLREQQKQFGMEYPYVKTPVELAGGFALPVGIIGKAFKTASPEVQAMLSGESLLGQAARGTAIGAGTGALSGMGYAEKDTGAEAGLGALFGGAVGGTVPLVIKGATTVIKNVLNANGIGDQALASNKMLASYLQKDNLTAEEAQTALDELRRIGVPNPVIADLGKNLKDLAYSSYVVQSKAKGPTEQFLENRLIDQPNDIVRGLVEKAGLAKNVNGYEYLTALAENQSSAASAAYPQAYKLAIDANPFRKYVERPVFLKAYQEAVDRAGVYGETLPDLSAIKNAQSVPTDILHQIKMGLDRVINKETDAVTNKVTPYGRDVVKVKNEFNDLIKANNPEYAKANAEFADYATIQKAFQLGQKYQSVDVKEAAAKLKAFNDAEKEAFRLGMMADINQRLGNFKSGDFSRQVFKSDNQKLLVRYAFDDQQKYNDFSKYVKALGEQSKTAKTVLGGSPTAGRLAAQEQAGDIAQMAQSAATGGLTGLAVAAGKSMLSRAKGIGTETSEQLQKRLFTVDPIEQRAILIELNRRAQTRPTGLLSGAAGLGTATGILGD